jgi:soluble lytic murein transglycosylase-like protein
MADGFKFQDLIDALIQQESEGDPMAVSDAGAVGLMQIMPQFAHNLHGSSAPSVFDAARERGFDVQEETIAAARGLLFDPEINYALGDPYLRDLMRQYDGNIDLALTAYNAGPNAMDSVLASGGGIQDFADPEAQEYAQKVREKYMASNGRPMPDKIDTRRLTRPQARPAGLLD